MICGSVVTLKNKKPRWANKKPKKTQGQIYIDFAKISRRKSYFSSRNPTFPPKKISFNFRPDFSHFHPFSSQKSTTNFLLKPKTS